MSWDSLDKIASEVMDFGVQTKVYRIDDVQKVATEWVDVGRNNWLAVVCDGDSISYGLYSFFTSDDTATYVDCVFRGNGYAGALREMRHTYFHPDGDADEKGYVFYLPIEATIKALTHLKKYFKD